MSIECEMSRVPRSRGAPCGVLLGKMKLMMKGENRSINRTHGSTSVIFARLWIYTPRFGM